MARPIRSAILAISVLLTAYISAPSAWNKMAYQDKLNIANSLNRASPTADVTLVQQYDSAF